MSRWYAYRRWVYTALVVLLVLDAGVYFGWVQRPPMARAEVPGDQRGDS